MLKSVAIAYFNNKEGRSGAAAIAKALKLSDAAVSMWPDTVPELSARRIHDLVRSKIPLVRIPNRGWPKPKFDNEDYPWFI